MEGKVTCVVSVGNKEKPFTGSKDIEDSAQPKENQRSDLPLTFKPQVSGIRHVERPLSAS